ncbi:branched-chain amino acid ABC transporter permease [Pararhodobacter sp. CCB-MM2]|uniref:branched-chain amino acid ABC transporter permease n=1 Tax=Pararhodobacter sp. CCB-MM2 TaxID=1786003 RepID=UPI00082BA19A|nr:branched-chain amino acid ABC transporter permease [Pararhodobacter sp. CCB-MM2]
MPQTFAPRHAGTLATSVLILGAAVVLPQTLGLFTLLQLTVYAVMAILALSLSITWGLGGVLCFGQAAFFGLGGYTYAVAVTNFGESTLPILLAVLVQALVALCLGWFMFMGRLSDLYVGVVTLCTSLILFNFANSTSDPWYRIGSAALNGFNGMPAIRGINIPFLPGALLSPVQSFVLTMLALLAVYLLCKTIAGSSWGRVVAATRQNPLRAELMGYDTARVKLGIFVIGSAVAGFAGCLFVNWNGFVSPDVFGLSMSAQIMIWMIVGGRETFVGPIVGAFALQALVSRLGVGSEINANVVLGGLLMIFVVLVPRGILPTVRDGLLSLGRKWGPGKTREVN